MTTYRANGPTVFEVHAHAPLGGGRITAPGDHGEAVLGPCMRPQATKVWRALRVASADASRYPEVGGWWLVERDTGFRVAWLGNWMWKE